MTSVTRCMKCGRPIDEQGTTYQEVYDKETGEWIGDRCHPNCPPEPASEVEKMCLQLINFLELGVQVNHEQLTRLAELLITTANMREAQIAYFKTRDPSIVAVAKKLEKHTDVLLTLIKEYKLPLDLHPDQPPLFNMEEQ